MLAPDKHPVAADWGRVAALYGQCLSAALDEEPFLPPRLPGFLAEQIARQSASYYGHYDQLVSDVAREFSRVSRDVIGHARSSEELYFDTHFAVLDEYQEDAPTGRRRPTPFEAVVETARRLRDLEMLETAMSKHTLGAIVGGSASYGRFYNIVGGSPSRAASDIDLLAVVPILEDIDELLISLGAESIVSPDVIPEHRDRLGAFLRASTAFYGDPVAFSAKIPVWEGGGDPLLEHVAQSSLYHVSLHAMDYDTFAQITLKQASRLDPRLIGHSQLLADFRETLPRRIDHQRNFAGRNLRLPLEAANVAGQQARRSHVFYIDDHDAYHPGMVQNLILPQFDVLWGTTQFRRDVHAFRWKMVERLRYEQRVRPDELLRLSFSHTRSQIFAPHAIRGVDQSTLMP